MMKRIPHKIDMGAVYAVPPKQKSFSSKDSFKEVQPMLDRFSFKILIRSQVEREFVLDIDLTDYQDDGTIQTNCIDPSDPEFKKSFRRCLSVQRIFIASDLSFKGSQVYGRCCQDFGPSAAG